MIHNTNTIFKVRDKVLKSNARNSNRMGGKLQKPWLGPYIVNQDLGKDRYCLITLEGKPLKQTIRCACLKRFLDPVIEEEVSLSNDEDILNEVEELKNSGSECANATLDSNANDIASEQEAADEKGIGDSVDHEDDDNYKEPRFHNEHKKKSQLRAAYNT